MSIAASVGGRYWDNNHRMRLRLTPLELLRDFTSLAEHNMPCVKTISHVSLVRNSVRSTRKRHTSEANACVAAPLNGELVRVRYFSDVEARPKLLHRPCPDNGSRSRKSRPTTQSSLRRRAVHVTVSRYINHCARASRPRRHCGDRPHRTCRPTSHMVFG